MPLANQSTIDPTIWLATRYQPTYQHPPKRHIRGSLDQPRFRSSTKKTPSTHIAYRCLMTIHISNFKLASKMITLSDSQSQSFNSLFAGGDQPTTFYALLHLHHTTFLLCLLPPHRPHLPSFTLLRTFTPLTCFLFATAQQQPVCWFAGHGYVWHGFL